MGRASASTSGSLRATPDDSRNWRKRWSRPIRQSLSPMARRRCVQHRARHKLFPLSQASVTSSPRDFIESMARPGGNITGVSMLVPELDAKRLEVLRDILPSARRLGLLMETGTRSPAVLQPMLATAQALGVALQNVEVSTPADFPA